MDFIFLGSKITVDGDCSHEIKRCLLLGNKSYDFSSSHVWMWELDQKDGWALKNWCFWTVVLEKTLESPLDCKIKPVHPKGNHPWIFPDAKILVSWMLSLKPVFKLSFMFIKRLFSSSSFSAIRVVSSAYLRLLVLFLAILIPAYASSSLAFCMMYSAYKLNN